MTLVRYLLVIVGLFCLISCSDPASKLPVDGVVPPFSLIDVSGQNFNGDRLAGKVWVADFIYTRCPGPCPRMSSQMHALSQAMTEIPDLRFVSFTVDPANDTPAVLAEYSRHFGGQEKQWSFLTGSPQTLHRLAHDVFMVGDLVGVMDHSTRFVLVDRKRRLRGFYSTFDPEGMAALQRDIRVLLNSRS